MGPSSHAAPASAPEPEPKVDAPVPTPPPKVVEVAEVAAPTQTLPEFEADHQGRWAERAGLTYLEVVTGGAAFDDSLPIVVAIHGLGSKPESFYSLMAVIDQPTRLILPRGIDAHSEGWSWFPLRARDEDIESLSAGIDKAATLLVASLRELEGAVKSPKNTRMVLTGFSQGGMLSFTVATKAPELFSHVIPVGGWLPGPLLPEADAKGLSHSPEFVALHGDADPAVKIQPTRDAVTALQAKGYKVELHEYPGVEHAIPPDMRAEFNELLRLALGGESFLNRK